MTRYSIEPPRRDLIVHHTFDDVELDRVIDYSPQAIDGKVVGDVDFGHTGTVGSAARMRANDSNINISGLPEQLPLDELHTSSWGRSEREVEVTALNAYATIEIDGTEHQLSFSSNEPTADWQYASLSYDGERAQLRYSTIDDSEPSIVDEVDAVGEVTDFELTFYTNGRGFVDDVRVYRTTLTDEQDRDIFNIGAQQTLVDEIGAVWDNDGLPYIKGLGNANFASALGESKAQTLRYLDALLEARHIQHAAGDQLDRIGQIGGVRRREGEADDHYRARIIATLATARSAGTFGDIIETVATILDTTLQRIELERLWETEPTDGIATAELFVRRTDIDAIELTTSELTDILKDVVPAGHDIEVTETGENPFTVRNDAQANDSSLGLTSDSIATGGGLVSDV